MNKSIIARQKGDDYQYLYFWKYAMKMFDSNEGIEKIVFESKERKYFDDFVVYYEKESYPKDNLNNSIFKDFFQIKYHVRNEKLLSIDNFINKDYIKAKTSILERLKELNKKFDSNEIRYIFITPHDIDPNDELYDLISNEDGRILLEDLFDNTTDRSKMGKVRKKFREHLNCSDDELKEILMPFRFQKGKRINELIDTVNDKLSIYNFEIIDKSSNINKYIELIKNWHYKGKTIITKEFIFKECEDEGLIEDYSKIDDLNNEIVDRINDINNEFIEKNYDSGPLINRTEADTIIHDIKDHNICILGEPGTGKTTLLYQIINKLDELNEYNYLILDLERYGRFTDGLELSKKMGFDYAIEKILKKLDNPLLIIDQLDIISMSRGLNTNSKSSLFTLLKKINNKIPFIITCREFDFKDDIEIKKFMDDEENEVSQIYLNNFTDTQINEYLEEIGIENNFNKKQREILSNPLNLNILKNLKEKKHDLKFNNLYGLYNEYYLLKKRVIQSKFPHQWNKILNKIFRIFEKNKEIYISLDELDEFSEVIELMISEGIFIKSNHKIRFAHNNLLDFFYVKHFISSEKDLYDYLINGPQDLFSRFIVTSVLNYEKEHKYPNYISEVKKILNEPKIRNHIKSIVLSILTNVKEVNKEGKLVKELIIKNDPSLNNIIWNNLYGSKVWYDHLYTIKLIDELYMDPEFENRIFRLLRNVTDKTENAGQFYLRHFNENEKINENAIDFLFLSELKFESTFNLLIKLFDENIIQRYVTDEQVLLRFFIENSLHSLTPPNAITLIYAILNNILTNKKYSVEKILNYEFFNDNLSVFEKISENNFENFIEKIFPIIEKISNLNKGQNNSRDCWIDLYDLNEEKRFNKLILSTLIASLSNLSRKELKEFEKYEKILQNSSFTSSKYILLSVYAKNKELSRNAFKFLFSLKKNEISLLYREILKLIENMDKKVLLKELEKFKEFGKNNFSGHDYEIYEYHLYNSISELTSEYDEKLNYLNEKYPNKPQKEKGHAYYYNSVTEDVSKFTDEQWLTFMKENNKSAFHIIDGPYDEANALKDCVKKDPKRFIKLIKKFTADIHPYYYQAILRGICDNSISYEESITVCKICHELEDKSCGKEITELLTEFPEEIDDEGIVLIRYYIYDYDDSEVNYCTEGRSEDILTEGINTVKGCALKNLAYILYENKKLSPNFMDILEKMVINSPLSIRAILANVIGAVYNYNHQIGLNLFKKLMDYNNENLLKTFHVERFISFMLQNHYDEVKYLINRMLKSENGIIKQVGSRILTRKAIINNSLKYIENCLTSKNIFIRRGVIEAVLNEFDAINDNYFLKVIILCFLNDTDEEILNNLSNLMSKIARNKCHYFEDEILKYISKDLDYSNYWHLIYSFSEISGGEEDEFILKAIKPFIDKFENNSIDIRKADASISTLISDIILKIYEENIDDEQIKNQCLDYIDIMVKEDLYNFENKLNEKFNLFNKN